MPVANWSNRDFCSASQLRIHCSIPLVRMITNLGVENTDGPEVSDDLILLCVASVIGVLLPVLDIDICNATNQKLQLPLVKYIDKVRWYKLVEARHKRVELRFNSLLDSPFGDKTNAISRVNWYLIQDVTRTQRIPFWFRSSLRCYDRQVSNQHRKSHQTSHQALRK